MDFGKMKPADAVGYHQHRPIDLRLGSRQSDAHQKN